MLYNIIQITLHSPWLPKTGGFSMKHTFIRKPLSVLLSILMVLSVFGGMAFPAGAESKTIAQGVIYKQGDTIVLPGDGDYYVDYYGATPVSGNGTVTRFEGDEYGYELEIDGWDIYAYLDTFDYEEWSIYFEVTDTLAYEVVFKYDQESHIKTLKPIKAITWDGTDIDHVVITDVQKVSITIR